MVMVDELRRWPHAGRLFRDGSAHLTADSLEELHAFARSIGLNRAWFQNRSAVPHYDLTAGRRDRALRAGAVLVPAREQARRRRAKRATERLRQAVERPETCHFWGQKHTITPRVIGQVFGDGKSLICVTPLATRPNYFVVRVDSAPDFDLRDILDEVICAAEEEYGTEEKYDGEEEAEPQGFPIVDWGMGCCWGDRFTLDNDERTEDTCTT